MIKDRLKITTRLIVDEAEARGYSVEVLDAKKCFIRIKDSSGEEYLLRSNTSAKTSAISYLIANHKPTVSQLMRKCGVPVPAECIYTDPDSALKFLHEHKNLVVKPVDAAHGNGVTVGVKTREELERAIDFAHTFSRNIILQEFVSGQDYRLLLIGGQLAAAAIRKPAFVLGDGLHTVGELIEIENSSSERGRNYSKKLNLIDVRAAKRFLGDALQKIPALGQEVQVVGTANIGAGGIAIDVTDDLPRELVEMGGKASRVMSMGLCAVDIIMEGKDVATARLIEVNASPTFGMHEYPSVGSPRRVTKKFLDWLIEA